MEQFKNLLQMMIWMHNRLDIDALESLRIEIDEDTRLGSYEQEVLQKVRIALAIDCDVKLRKKEKAHATMA